MHILKRYHYYVGMDNCVGTDMDTDIAIDAAGFSFISVIIMVTVTVLSCILTWMCGVACGAGISHHVMKSQQPVLIQEPNKELVGITTKFSKLGP